MKIVKSFLNSGQGVRTGRKLTSLKGLVIHWIGAASSHAEVIRNNFSHSATGTHYIIDWNDGHIIQCVPEDEVCFHVGANKYTKLKEQICGNKNPNNFFVGIECCIGDSSIPKDWYDKKKYPNLGIPSTEQYNALVEFAADFLKRHNMTINNLYRHYDITGKQCHVYFVNHEDKWQQFKQDVANVMEDKMTKEQILAEVGDVFIKDFSELPAWAQEIKPLLDIQMINGGTSYEVNPTDINMYLSDIKTVLICKRMIERATGKKIQ